MRKVTIDVEDCRSAHDLHVAFQNALELPQFYGKNLDALSDCLSGFVDTPITIELRGFHAARKYIGDYADRVLDVLRNSQSQAAGITVIVGDT